MNRGQTGGPWRAILITAVAAALSTAALHLAARGIRLLLLSEFQPTGPDTIWKAPLAELVFFLALAVPFLVAARVRRSPIVPRAAVFVFVTLTVFFGGLQTRALHPIAVLLLGIGAGWRLAAFWRTHPEGGLRWTRRVAATLAAVFVAAGVVELWQTRDHGPPDAAAAPGAPNVLILLLDTVGAKHLSLYGYRRNTSPHLDSLAREATVFDNAIAPSSWTLPSHASMFTGVAASRLSARWTVPLDAAYPTLAEQFDRLGYRTAGFVANLTYAGPATGLARGFQFYRADLRTPKDVAMRASFAQMRVFWQLRYGSLRSRWRTLLPPDVQISWETRKHPKTADDVAREFLRWQAGVGERPFFAFLNFYDAHYPFFPPAPYRTRFGPPGNALDQYDGGIAYIDDVIARVLRTLRQRGALDRTIVIVTSDHGNAFGEHGLTSHGNSLYRELIHVPLLVRYPARVPADHRVARVVSLADLGATVLDLAGARMQFPGASLAPQWERRDAAPRVALSWVERSPQAGQPASDGELACATDDDSQLIVGEDGHMELYDYHADPDELVNVARETGRQATLWKLHSALNALGTSWYGSQR